MSQISPNPTDQTNSNCYGSKHCVIQASSSSRPIRDHSKPPHPCWQGLNLRAKALALAVACLTLPVWANRTNAYDLTNQAVLAQTPPSQTSRTTTSANIVHEPQRQMMLTFVIEAGVAALLLGSLITTYLANRAFRRIQIEAKDQKLDKGEPDSPNPELAQLAPQFVKDQERFLEKPEDSSEQISLREQPEVSLEHAQILSNFNLLIRQSLYREDILKAAVKEVRRALKMDRVVIYALNPINWDGVIVAESVQSEWPRLLGVRLHDPCFSKGHVEMYKRGRVRAINNIYQEPDLTDCHVRALEQFAVKANLVAPILRHGELLALMIAHQCSQPRIWDKSEVALFAQLATQVGIAVDQANLIEQQEVAVERAQLLAEITLRLHSSLDLEDLLKTTVKEVRRVLKTERVVIYALDPTSWDGLILAESVAYGWPQMLKVRLYDPCFKERYVEIYKQGRVHAINDIHREPNLSDCHIKILEQFAVKANLVAPIRKNDQLLGLMIAHHCSEPHIWDKSEVEFFTQIATQVGIATDHLSFLEKLEQEQAR